MRKALFAMILVVAAFAGGAAINGPGLNRLKGFLEARFQPEVKPRSPVIDPALAAQKEAPPRNVPAVPAPTPSLGDVLGDRAPLPSSMKPDNRPKPRPVPTPEIDAALVQAKAETSRVAPDWNDLRRRMRELGVTRYEVDGDPNGRSRFRCVIPLAGTRAVAQQFEGEGDDDLQAAESALRRVTLWRAAEEAAP